MNSLLNLIIVTHEAMFMFYAIRFEFKQIVFFVRIKIPPNNASEELNSDPKPKDVH